MNKILVLCALFCGMILPAGAMEVQAVVIDLTGDPDTFGLSNGFNLPVPYNSFSGENMEEDESDDDEMDIDGGSSDDDSAVEYVDGGTGAPIGYKMPLVQLPLITTLVKELAKIGNKATRDEIKLFSYENPSMSVVDLLCVTLSFLEENRPKAKVLTEYAYVCLQERFEVILGNKINSSMYNSRSLVLVGELALTLHLSKCKFFKRRARKILAREVKGIHVDLKGIHVDLNEASTCPFTVCRSQKKVFRDLTRHLRTLHQSASEALINSNMCLDSFIAAFKVPGAQKQFQASTYTGPYTSYNN